jgi:aspartate/methionine/tyrosine aminotransferase
MDCKYFVEKRNFYETQANILLKGLVDSSLNLNFWVPKGGYFLLTDISEVEIPEQYFVDPENGPKLTRDFAFVYYLANEFGVVCIPMSPYFSDKELG